MVTPHSPLGSGGVERHVREVATRLRAAGVHVEILCSDATGKSLGIQVHEGVTIRSLRGWPSNRDWFFTPGIWREIKRADADLIHVQSYHSLVAPLAMLRAHTQRIPYVLTFHGGGHSSPLRNRLRSTQRLALRPLLVRARRLIALARFEIPKYGQELRIPADHFVLIPNGSDLDMPEADGRPSEGPSPVDGPVIASIGRLERYKGHQRLIAALPYVLERCPNARALVVGVGPYEQELRAAAVSKGVVDSVEFTSIPSQDRRAMWNFLQTLSMVVLLSDYETHPLTALEAAMARRRLLVSNRGGLLDLVSDGIARGIEPDAPPESVARAIVEELDRPLPTARPVLDTWDDCAAGLLDLYRSLV